MRRLPFLIILLLVQQLSAQSPHGDQLDIDCSFCHQPEDWRVIPEKIQFDHSEAGFILTGQHINVNCKSCHTNLVFKGTPDNCYSCHKDVHQNTTSQECSGCHSPRTWIIKNINELHQRTRFPLTGVHRLTDCRQCHKGFNNLTFEPLDIRCYGCHSRDYASAKLPDHSAAGFSTSCEDCHSINSFAWSARNFDHNFFPLQGGHNIPGCFTCHTNSSFKGLSTECYSCHKQDYESTDDPDHEAAGFSTVCSQCHSINNWDDADFDHNITGFILLGAHINVNCSDCHTSDYSSTSALCNSCHNDNYLAAQNPDHKAAAIPSECQNCHNEYGWRPSTFSHSTTGFELRGAHIPLQCSSCHKGTISGLSTNCNSCHNDAYLAAQNPNHQAAAIPSECQNCHTETAWIPSTFDHASTGFILTGQHSQIQCSSCHQGTISGLTSSCFSCHNDDYASAPNHSAQGYPQSCEMCHNTIAWEQTDFNHQNTSFPLTGAHLTTGCLSCHSGGFTGTTHVCYECHQSDYTASVNPNHSAIQIPTTCETCHTTNPDWQPASFPIHNNYYELLGAHLSIQNNCSACHKGNYNQTANTCFGCHADKYNATTNPNHQAAGFPVECASCHSQTSWTPANWNHDAEYFPIYSGKHAGTWDRCSDCHTNQNDFRVFSCTTCHTQTETDNDHSEVTGYVYESQACLNCHPRGDSNILKNLRNRVVN